MTVNVNLGADSYDIVIKRGVLAEAGKELNLNRRVLIVTDSGVPAVYAATVAAQCREAHTVTLPTGEASKNLDSFRLLLTVMLEHAFTRGDCVVAVGGGVVGDLAGFTASAYMRGVDFYNIPTTLLSQIDSSIGGKTGVDLDGVKNAVGSFYQPRRVLIDPDTLATLDPRQRAAGLAEAVKIAATLDAALFARIEACTSLEADLTDIITRAIELKRDVVEQDPKEKGLRRVLNFGHTVGHAVESHASGALLHGECVALGMLPMSRGEARARLAAVLDKYGLPIEIKAPVEELMPYLIHDKKSTEGGVLAVYVPQIGSYEIKRVTPEELLSEMGEGI